MPSSKDLYGDKEFTPMGLLGPETNIDRRGAKRIVPMKVLCLGLGRTGTSSLRAALISLGIRDCYHMCSIAKENPKDTELWVEALNLKYNGGHQWGREDFDQVLGHCMAVSDWPCALFPDELIKAYPEAKVILTVRDSVEDWHKSVMNTLWLGAYGFAKPKSLTQALFQYLSPRPPGYEISKYTFRHTTLGNHPEEGREGYLKHNEHIRAIAPKGKFLEYNVKQGWGPLCEFLELPVPDRPFPRVNDAQIWLDDVKVHVARTVVKSLRSGFFAFALLGLLVMAIRMRV